MPSPSIRLAPPALAVALLLALLATVLVATPAAAESRCWADDAGDVDANNTEADERLDTVPEIDILAVCADLNADRLQMTFRVAAPHDPAGNADWDDTATSLGVEIDVMGEDPENTDRDYTVNMARFQDQPAGAFPEVRVYKGNDRTAYDPDGDGPQAPCAMAGAFDGLRYTLTLPARCIDNVSSIQLAMYAFHDAQLDDPSAGFYDEVPAFPEYNGPVTTAADAETPVDRLSGPARVETAIVISQDDFEEGTADAVVLARADASPDALAGAPLAVAVNGPLLLTARDSLPTSVEAEIQRVLPDGGRVVLSGGTAAIADSVADRLVELGYEVTRAAGDTRYATSVEVARAAVENPSVIVVADGNGFADALVGGALAAEEAGVQVLSNGTQLDQTATDYLAEHPDAEVIAVGQNAVQAVPDANVQLSGSSSFETAVAVARERYDNPSGVAIASGTNFPDGLAGGAHAGRAGIPLLLSWPDVLPDSASTYLSEVTPLDRVVMYGGVAATSYTVETTAASALG